MGLMNGCTGKERDRRGSSSSTGLCVWLSEIRLSSPERDTYEQATEQANAGLLVQNQLVSANFTPLAEECELWYLVEGCASGISSIGRQDGLSFLLCERGLEGYRLHKSLFLRLSCRRPRVKAIVYLGMHYFHDYLRPGAGLSEHRHSLC